MCTKEEDPDEVAKEKPEPAQQAATLPWRALEAIQTARVRTYSLRAYLWHGTSGMVSLWSAGS